MFSQFTSATSPGARKSESRRRGSRKQPRYVEPLESRDLMSATTFTPQNVAASDVDVDVPSTAAMVASETTGGVQAETQSLVIGGQFVFGEKFVAWQVGNELRIYATEAGYKISVHEGLNQQGEKILYITTTDLLGSGNFRTETLAAAGIEKLTYHGTSGNDRFDNNTGVASTGWGYEGHDTMLGGSNTDVFYGGAGNDWLDGRGGNDVIYGQSGSDVLLGGFGNDILRGGEGNDTLMGHDGYDVLYGEGGNDYLYGGAHNDVLVGGAEGDFLNGGWGADLYVDYRPPGDIVVADSQDVFWWQSPPIFTMPVATTRETPVFINSSVSQPATEAPATEPQTDTSRPAMADVEEPALATLDPQTLAHNLVFEAFGLEMDEEFPVL